MNEDKFSGKANVYSEFRPSYPKALFQYLKDSLGLVVGKIVADVGSGTGIFTKQLLAEGCFVYAVEPNEDMRKTAENDLIDNNKFHSIGGTAEKTGLEDGCVDFVTASQAFHWFDTQKFKLECKRILKNDGKVILVWNKRGKENTLVKENAEINKRFCANFKGFSGGIMDNDLKINELFSKKFETAKFDNNLLFNEMQFIGRNLSSSYSPADGDINYEPYISALKDLFLKHSKNRILEMPNSTACYFGTLN